MTNATSSGQVDGFYADKFQEVLGPNGEVPKKRGRVVSNAKAAAWNAGHEAVLERMVATFGSKSMLLHLTVTLPNQYWRTPSMTPVEIYT